MRYSFPTSGFSVMFPQCLCNLIFLRTSNKLFANSKKDKGLCEKFPPLKRDRFLWMQLAEQYGPVFSLRKGSTRMVFVSGYKMVKEALVNQMDSFVDRPVIPLFHKTVKGMGE